MSDEVDDIGAPADVAFVKSENHEFDGIKLEPYSPARMIAAQSMGLVYGHVDDAGVAVYNKTKVYPGAVRDVAIVLWLCTVKDEDALDRAARNPIGSVKEAINFAAQHRCARTNDDNFWAAYVVFFEIMDEIEKSQVDAKKKTAQPEPLAAVTT